MTVTTKAMKPVRIRSGWGRHERDRDLRSGNGARMDRPSTRTIPLRELMTLLRHEYPEYAGRDGERPLDPRLQRDLWLASHPELAASM